MAHVGKDDQHVAVPLSRLKYLGGHNQGAKKVCLGKVLHEFLRAFLPGGYKLLAGACDTLFKIPFIAVQTSREEDIRLGEAAIRDTDHGDARARRDRDEELPNGSHVALKFRLMVESARPCH